MANACADGRVVVFSASPRKGGNSNFAAVLLAEKMSQLARKPCVVLQAWEHSILGCTGCGTCRKKIAAWNKKEIIAQGQIEGFRAFSENFLTTCPLYGTDTSAPLLQAMIQASLLVFVSPIYQYNIPSGARAVLERLQPFFEFSRSAEAGLPGRETPEIRWCQPVFIAGRKRGEKLFEGSRLSLKYALAPLGYRMMPALTFRGLDEADALRNSPASQSALLRQANALAKKMAL